MDLGERIRFVRKLRNMTQLELAEVRLLKKNTQCGRLTTVHINKL